MEFFKIRRTIPFMRYALIFNVISLITFVAAVFFLATSHLNFSIEFTGGTLIEVGYKEPANVDAIRRALDRAGYKAEVQNFGSSREVLIRMHLEKNQSSADLSQKVLQILKTENQSAELRRVEFVGPQVGRGKLARLVDPFAGGRPLTSDRAMRLAIEATGDPTLTPHQVIVPATPREVLLRVDKTPGKPGEPLLQVDADLGVGRQEGRQRLRQELGQGVGAPQSFWHTGKARNARKS